MNIQSVAALTACLLGLAGCKEDDLERTVAFLRGDQARLDQLNQEQDGRIAALYAQVSSKAHVNESSNNEQVSSNVLSSSSSTEVAATPPEPPKEPCVPIFRLLSCGPNGEYLWW